MTKNRKDLGVTDLALIRLSHAIDNGTGWHVSAIEVQGFAIELIAEWAHDLRYGAEEIDRA